MVGREPLWGPGHKTTGDYTSHHPEHSDGAQAEELSGLGSGRRWKVLGGKRRCQGQVAGDTSKGYTCTSPTSLEQLSALARGVFQQDGAPYTHCGVFVPFGQRALRASRCRTYIQTPEGFTAKEVLGPASFVQWRACYRVLKSALIMLDCVSLANIHAYEVHMEKLTRLYPTTWHLVYSADDLARSSQAN